MSQKKPLPKPSWIKNTYFWIAAILFVLAIVGIIFGDPAIRDPGQKRESGLVILYFVAAAIMLINGYISHRATVQQYEEELQAQQS